MFISMFYTKLGMQQQLEGKLQINKKKPIEVLKKGEQVIVRFNEIGGDGTSRGRGKVLIESLKYLFPQESKENGIGFRHMVLAVTEGANNATKNPGQFPVIVRLERIGNRLSVSIKQSSMIVFDKEPKMPPIVADQHGGYTSAERGRGLPLIEQLTDGTLIIDRIGMDGNSGRVFFVYTLPLSENKI